MNVKSIIATILIASSLIGSGKEIKVGDIEIDGAKYKKATIEYSSGLNAKIHHDEGVKTIPVQGLPEEILSQLGITNSKIKSIEEKNKSDAKLALSKQKEQLEKKKKLQELLDRSEKYIVVVYGYYKHGVLAYESRAENEDMIYTPNYTKGNPKPIFLRSYKYHDTPISVIITGMKNPKSFVKGQHYHFQGINKRRVLIDNTTMNEIQFLQFTPLPKGVVLMSDFLSSKK